MGLFEGRFFAGFSPATHCFPQQEAFNTDVSLSDPCSRLQSPLPSYFTGGRNSQFENPMRPAPSDRYTPTKAPQRLTESPRTGTATGPKPTSTNSQRSQPPTKPSSLATSTPASTSPTIRRARAVNKSSRSQSASTSVCWSWQPPDSLHGSRKSWRWSRAASGRANWTLPAF